MTNRCRSLVTLLLFSGFYSLAYAESRINKSSIWQESPVGTCYESIDKYLESAYGPNFRNDENIKTYELQGGHESRDRVKFIWATDTTPQNNITRVLFKGYPVGKVCAILFVPLSSDVSVKLTEKKALPPYVVSKNTPPPGFSVTQITQKLNEKTQTYSPYKCHSISKVGTKAIPCKSIFSE